MKPAAHYLKLALSEILLSYRRNSENSISNTLSGEAVREELTMCESNILPQSLLFLKL